MAVSLEPVRFRIRNGKAELAPIPALGCLKIWCCIHLDGETPTALTEELRERVAA